MMYSANKFSSTYISEMYPALPTNVFSVGGTFGLDRKTLTLLILKVSVELKISSCPTHSSSRHSRSQSGECKFYRTLLTSALPSASLQNI